MIIISVFILLKKALIGQNQCTVQAEKTKNRNLATAVFLASFCHCGYLLAYRCSFSFDISDDGKTGINC